MVIPGQTSIIYIPFNAKDPVKGNLVLSLLKRTSKPSESIFSLKVYLK